MHFISPVLWQFLVKWLTNFALFPAEASKIAPDVDALYFFLISHLGCRAWLLVVMLVVVGFSIAYRAGRRTRSPPISKGRPSSKPPGPSFPWRCS